jgi:hypothetical protein
MATAAMPAVHRLARGSSASPTTYKTPPPSSSPPRTAQSSSPPPLHRRPQGTRTGLRASPPIRSAAASSSPTSGLVNSPPLPLRFSAFL